MVALITLVWSIPSANSADYPLTTLAAVVVGRYLYIDGGEIQLYDGGGNTTNLPGICSQPLYGRSRRTMLIEDRELYLLH